MGNVAKKLEPPYFAAVINNNDNQINKIKTGVPSDELVTSALHQPGFLGLEMTQIEGRQVPVSYWKQKGDVERWKSFAGKKIAEKFNGTQLEEACTVQVSMVKRMFFMERHIPTT